MTLIETRDIAEILKIIPHEIEIRQKGRDRKPLKDMLSSVKRRLETDNQFHVFLAKDAEDKLTAYAFFALHCEPEEKRLELCRIWHDEERPSGLMQIVKALRRIVKQYKLESVTAIAQSKEMTAIAKEWGFKMAGVVMEKKVRR